MQKARNTFTASTKNHPAFAVIPPEIAVKKDCIGAPINSVNPMNNKIRRALGKNTLG